MANFKVVREELAQGLKQYLEESSLHGYKYLLSQHGWLWRIVWVRNKQVKSNRVSLGSKIFT